MSHEAPRKLSGLLSTFHWEVPRKLSSRAYYLLDTMDDALCTRRSGTILNLDYIPLYTDQVVRKSHDTWLKVTWLEKRHVCGVL